MRKEADIKESQKVTNIKDILDNLKIRWSHDDKLEDWFLVLQDYPAKVDCHMMVIYDDSREDKGHDDILKYLRPRTYTQFREEMKGLISRLEKSGKNTRKQNKERTKE